MAVQPPVDDPLHDDYVAVRSLHLVAAAPTPMTPPTPTPPGSSHPPPATPAYRRAYGTLACGRIAALLPSAADWDRLPDTDWGGWSLPHGWEPAHKWDGEHH